MKTIVFFLVSLDPKVGKANVPALKKKVVEYVGTRMLAEDMDDIEYCPGVMLKDTLSDADKKELNAIVNESGNGGKAGLLFLELTNEEYKTVQNADYIDCVGKL